MNLASAWRAITWAVLLAAVAGPAAAQTPRPPAATQPAAIEGPFLDDRGSGVATSMFGTYIARGELIVYPFFEYYRDGNLEYAPEELGASGRDDYRGRYRAREGLIFIAFGLHDNVAVEFEAAMISASLDKAPDDQSSLPARLTESGIGDIEGQLRWRIQRETAQRPELFSYTEVVFPHHLGRRLIGTPGWEVKAGGGVTRGFRWGTLTGRAAIEWAEDSTSHFDVGEYAFEYLKRLSPNWRVYLGIEGTQDELSLITEAQWFLRPGVFLKVNNGLGLTSKATGWAPEIGMLVTLPVR